MTKHIIAAHEGRLEAERELTRRSDQGESKSGGVGSRNVAVSGAADWLCLAAAPTFAFMALLMGVLGGHLPDICSTSLGSSPLSGMVPMYVLMSAFHSAPWLKLFSRWQWSRNKTHNRAGLKAVCSET
jgi:hypothetical protein